MAPNFSGPMPRPLNWDEQDLHFEMQQWYVFEEVTPADVSEEGSEEEGEGSEEEYNRVPFDDITNQLAWSNSTNT